MSMKNPLTAAGIEPATFRFVAQHLNHWATAVPRQTFIDPLNDPGRNCMCMVYKVTLLKTFKDTEVVNMLCGSWERN